MSIQETDILFKLSGGTSNTDPAAALGGAMSTQAGGIITKTKTLNSMFDDISGAEASAGDVEYRCFYVHNNHGTLTLTGAKIWIEGNTVSDHSTIAIGLDLAGKNGTADTITDESTAPDPTVTFSEACTSYATGLDLGNMAAGEKYAVWIRRTITAGMAAIDDDYWTIKVQGDTAA